MKKIIFLFALVFTVSIAMAQVIQNTATIDQYGSNIAKIEQIGISNVGKIAQGASGAAVSNNHVPAYAGDWKEGAFIYQSGERNNAEIDVNVSSNGSSIDQDGNDNWAKQEVNTTYARTTNWDRMGVDINQDGNNNWANQKTVPAFGSYGVQGMMINQTGNYNIADQLSIGGMSNITEITQLGSNNNNPNQSGNTYDISLTGLADPLLLSWIQKPAGLFTQYTNQRLGVTHIYVDGSNNNTHQYQERTLVNGAITGNNIAYIDLYGSNNDVAQGQLGELNSSDIDIDGNGNVVTSSQFGDSNNVNIDLVLGSNNNVVGVQQVGDFHNATVFQSGASNFAKVIQQF